jgi:pimeloyl-ACP methyl ester carboxylesterase
MLHHRSVGSGPPVLLLPGMLGTIETECAHLIEPIAALGYTVIAADLPGHGPSEMTKSLTMRVILEEIDKVLLASKAEPVVILGYSLGGYAALQYGIKNPSRVLGVYMHGSKFYWSGAEAEEMAAELDLAWLTEHKPERLAKLQALHGAEKLEAMLPWLNKLLITLPDAGMTEMDLEEAKFPVVVSVGDRDELVPASEALDLYRALPKGQLAVFADTNHPLAALRDHVFLPVFRDFLNRLD